ncbi:hypothetical protein PI125_g15442 [Phytophthora idaei]|nr:hypothetical protein PI125_g15442 [Phytophthora idaei]
MEQDGNTDEGEETLLTELEIHEQESFAAALALTSLQCGVAESATSARLHDPTSNSAQTPTNGGGPPKIRDLLNFPHLVYPSVGRGLLSR